ncbi:DUF1513 domain-containing protein [Shimia sp. SDUM112013]|uniref:DUF1513 domain-containing protein n=1 Tax=Shimia sp. SDUM112013 TaxID=3136160 RepID=UPI0032EBA4C9
MTTRRRFLSGALASTLIPATGWAAAGSPAFLNAARKPDGQHLLLGLDGMGSELFRVPIPDRGHAATAHPTRAEAVAFARRPGTFAHVIDCKSGEVLHKMQTPPERHFYGHGAFSQGGTLLFTPENAYEDGFGVIGVWDTTGGYARLGEFPSGGIGPHEVLRLPGSDVLAICNGGIDTHPDTGRTKLNIPTMRPNLTYMAQDGTILEQVDLPDTMHKNSIRHMAVGPDGLVAFGMQWQGGNDAPPLVALHRRGNALALLEVPAHLHQRLRGYIGSVAMTENGHHLAVTSPRGGLVLFFETGNGTFSGFLEEPDVCGLGTIGDRFVITSGTGRFATINKGYIQHSAQHDLQFDNHLIAVPS